MIYICGYCTEGKVGRSHPPLYFRTWDDLMDHLVNNHRFKWERGRLVRR